MANALQIDTLKFARRLQKAGMEPQTAEAIAEGLAEADTSSLATKEDIAKLSAEVKTDIAGVKTEIAEMRSELKTEIAARSAKVETDIANLKADMFRHLWIMAAGIVAITVTLTKALP